MFTEMFGTFLFHQNHSHQVQWLMPKETIDMKN